MAYRLMAKEASLSTVWTYPVFAAGAAFWEHVERLPTEVAVSNGLNNE